MLIHSSILVQLTNQLRWLHKLGLMEIRGYLEKPEKAIGERNEGNDGNARNQGRNAGN